MTTDAAELSPSPNVLPAPSEALLTVLEGTYRDVHAHPELSMQEQRIAGLVVTVGTLRAGMNENVIPDRALLRLNVRTFKDPFRSRVPAAIRRILEAEATVSRAPKPPDYTVSSEYPVTRNDEAATARVVAALRRHFGPDRVHEIEPATASEDFGLFGAAWNVPAVFWVVGGIDPDHYREAEQAGKLDEIPASHAPDFAPVVHPTLRIGVEAMLAAAGVWPVREEATR